MLARNIHNRWTVFCDISSTWVCQIVPWFQEWRFNIAIIICEWIRPSNALEAVDVKRSNHLTFHVSPFWNKSQIHFHLWCDITIIHRFRSRISFKILALLNPINTPVYTVANLLFWYGFGPMILSPLEEGQGMLFSALSYKSGEDILLMLFRNGLDLAEKVRLVLVLFLLGPPRRH